MSLALEIEFLAGVCRAAREPGDDAPDWPPQPDRVFSALVSSWAARGECAEERAALEWLEEQEPPKVHASGRPSVRTTPDVFVPPNDPRSSRARKTYLKVLPDERPRQRRRFPVAVPDDPVVTLAWRANPDAAVFGALDAIARDVGYIGHSASVARLRFLSTAAEGEGVAARRRIYPGRLAELERAYRLNPARPKIAPGASVVSTPEPAEDRNDAGEWLVLEVVEGVAPDIRAAALVCRLLRQALMSGYKCAGRESAIPEIVSGHAPDGKPARRQHLAVAPMAFAGAQHADGHTMGYALIPPAGERLEAIPGFREAFEKVARYNPDNERRELVLDGAPLPEALRLAPAGSAPARCSLSTEPYVSPARVWASATPLVLDRHLKRRDEREVRELVARACENAGLPRPDPDRIRAGKHSAVEGMPSARPPAGAPPWMRWKTPKSLASRPLIHAVIDFGQDICGPVMLGAGRFTGLGLCRRLGNRAS